MDRKLILDKKLILDNLKTSEDKILVARLYDKITNAGKFHQVEVTDFFDPYQQSVITPVLNSAPGISFIMTGGYDYAERNRVIICPDYLKPEDEDDRISVLDIFGNFKFQHVTHRDYLGSILGLGIKREKIGDLIVMESGCQILLDREIAEYVKSNLTKVHKASVSVREITKDNIQVPEQDGKEISATVSSLRLDAVAAAGFGISRTKMSDEIQAEKVKVNWVTVSNCSFEVSKGDILSIRGKGRIEIMEVRGETKKGRISILLKRFK